MHPDEALRDESASGHADQCAPCQSYRRLPSAAGKVVWSQEPGRVCGIESLDELGPPARFRVGQTPAICRFVVPGDSLSISKDKANSCSCDGLGCLLSSRNPGDFPIN